MPQDENNAIARTSAVGAYVKTHDLEIMVGSSLALFAFVLGADLVSEIPNISALREHLKKVGVSEEALKGPFFGVGEDIYDNRDITQALKNAVDPNLTLRERDKAHQSFQTKLCTVARENNGILFEDKKSVNVKGRNGRILQLAYLDYAEQYGDRLRQLHRALEKQARGEDQGITVTALGSFEKAGKREAGEIGAAVSALDSIVNASRKGEIVEGVDYGMFGQTNTVLRSLGGVDRFDIVMPPYVRGQEAGLSDAIAPGR